MNFNKIFENNVTYDVIKIDQKKVLHSLQSVYFFIYVLRVKAWIFLNETSILDFAELEIFHSI